MQHGPSACEGALWIRVDLARNADLSANVKIDVEAGFGVHGEHGSIARVSLHGLSLCTILVIGCKSRRSEGAN